MEELNRLNQSIIEIYQLFCTTFLCLKYSLGGGGGEGGGRGRGKGGEEEEGEGRGKGKFNVFIRSNMQS